MSNSLYSTTPEPSGSKESKSVSASSFRTLSPSNGKALRNSVLDTVPSPFSSHSLKRSTKRTTLEESASRNCSTTLLPPAGSSVRVTCRNTLEVPSCNSLRNANLPPLSSFTSTWPVLSLLSNTTSAPCRSTLFNSLNSMVPDASGSNESKSSSTSSLPALTPSIVSALWNSFLEIMPSPSVSHSLKTSMIRAALALTASRNCCCTLLSGSAKLIFICKTWEASLFTDFRNACLPPESVLKSTAPACNLFFNFTSAPGRSIMFNSLNSMLPDPSASKLSKSASTSSVLASAPRSGNTFANSFLVT
mmetsp:Transcript_72006/g.154081  ORF Transcript_72006/g.154081 Transcript_72006/m.154081 type:complete len:305 (+) Transcript_72006:418-1332(+)